VEVVTDEGIRGIGECGVTWRERATLGALEDLKALVIGQDPFSTEHIWQLLYRGGFFPAQRIVGAAAAAIDIALWDIKGKALELPVYRLLGGPVRERVPCYIHIGHPSDPEKLVASAQERLEQGWRYLRFGLPVEDPIKEPTRAVLRSIEQMEALRKAVGEEPEILFDVHTRLDLADAVTLCRAFEPYRPFFVEDPLRCENPDSFKTLRPRTTVPLASGEQFSSKWEFRQLIEEEWIDYARIDLCICGGITEARKIAGWCETHYIKIAPHNPLGPVSAAACLHLDLASPEFGVQEISRVPGTYLQDVFPRQVSIEEGDLLPTEEPGLGIEFDAEAARKTGFKEGIPHILRREDGSFTNW
jgi:galactonate dehydratase